MHEKFFESSFVTFEITEKTVARGVVYRSPFIDPESNELFLQHLDECLNKIGPKQTCFIMSDFNYDLLASEATGNFKNRFVDTIFDNSFMSLINYPARITDSTATVLNHMWTSGNLHV